MKYFIYLFIFIFIYKALRNTCHYFRIKKLYSYFKTITSEKVEDINEKVFETKAEVIELFKKAGIHDTLVPTIKLLGYGQGVHYNASAFDTYPCNREDFLHVYLSIFDESIGTFKRRILEVFSPFYWIDLILFAPKNLLNYIGASPESRSTKILNILLTFIYWIFGIFIAIFKEKIHTFLLSYLP